MSFSAETIASLSGVALSLLFAYVPKLDAWYAALDPTKKRLVMAGLLLVVTGYLLWRECRAVTECYSANIETAFGLFIAAALANQSTYLLAPRKQ